MHPIAIAFRRRGNNEKCYKIHERMAPERIHNYTVASHSDLVEFMYRRSPIVDIITTNHNTRA